MAVTASFQVTWCGATLRKGDTQRVSQRISTSGFLVADSSYCCLARKWRNGVRAFAVRLPSRGPVLDGCSMMSYAQTPDMGDRLCRARVGFDLVAQDGAGIAGAGGGEVVAECVQGLGAPGRGERVEPDEQFTGGRSKCRQRR
jgi:hypothetical protein